MVGVLSSTDRNGVAMAKDHRRLDAQLVQEVLLDDPTFLRGIVERVVQQILEAEMTEHLGAAPYERVEGRTGQRNGYKDRKSTRLNSSHANISYAVFCLKK